MDWDTVFTVARTISFVWSFVLLLTLIYWGVQDLLLSRRCGHVQLPPEHYLFATSTMLACLTLNYSLGEIFLLEVMGGSRVFVPWIFLAVASAAVRQGAYRIQLHRRSIAMGLCGDGQHADHA